MTGKALPDLFHEMLFGPMGCARASSELSAAGAVVSASELLRIGQMLLNGGSYGHWRFFGPETLSQIYLPARLERSGPQKEVRWAMGTKIFDSDGLSGRAFGHSGAMGAFMFIDSVHELVLASASTEEGGDYHAWRGRVFGAVLKNIA